jgi:hypothetical protein
MRWKGSADSGVAHGPEFPSTATARHAAVRVEAHDRKRLEPLCRYFTRPALSDERVQLNGAGQVKVKLKTPRRDGTTHLVMGPPEFMLSDRPRWCRASAWTTRSGFVMQ